jgi:hypothetical protein
MGDAINLEPLSVDHLDDAVRPSLDASWPHTRADWLFAFELGKGFAAINNGQVVGTMLWWPLFPLLACKAQSCTVTNQQPCKCKGSTCPMAAPQSFTTCRPRSPPAKLR